MIVYVGDWRTGAVAAEPPHCSGVYGPEAWTSHQAMPPHREGQAGVLPTVCYVAGVGGHGQKLHPILCINPVKHTVFYPWWLSYTGHSCTTWCWINKDMKWVIYFVFSSFFLIQGGHERRSSSAEGPILAMLVLKFYFRHFKLIRMCRNSIDFCMFCQEKCNIISSAWHFMYFF